MTPDGHAWYVRRRRAKRQPPWQVPWQRHASYELSATERDTVPVLPDSDELVGPLVGLTAVDAEFGLLVVVAVVVALLALVALVVGALVGVARAWVVPLLVDHAGLVAAALAATAAGLLLDWLSKPWLIEAESAHLVNARRRIWRIRGGWRSRHAFRAVVAAIAEGRIGAEHGIVVFDDRPSAP